ncbi:homoserine dehydrogenase [Carboxydothermus pertinax]|uniref:Homoserine dehydrogenase n=1 Tax=Carboxydothermus pertinax TaxID=870242 RepID=A0A1L8CTP0_9THEO|nr:homoserine dehydrogenase [Carboxydothermus pertinax]GAV22286.1 homoserine dehydrogenase [Carboxydothermus pertinax]
MATVKIGLLGFGTVGRGVYKVLQTHREKIYNTLGVEVEIGRVLVRNLEKYQKTYPELIDLFTENPEEIIDNPEIKIIVEVMGGINPALDYVLQAMKNGKSVITANKDMVAERGRELFATHEEQGVDFLFEASVAGGIPIIRTLKESLAGNSFKEVIGIINGTTNYMLTKMSLFGTPYEEVLKEAQEKGYAEADPTSDVEGLDAARKLAILASIAFNSRVTFGDVYAEGITRITPIDIQYARELGGVIKLLGIAKEDEEGIEVRVHPTIIPESHPLAAVNDVFNAIFVEGDAVGPLMFYGRGAGELPTASAVVGDIIEAVKNISHHDTGRIGCTCYLEKPVKPIGEISSKYFIRLVVEDKPGVLASVAQVFGNQSVSIASVIQKRSLEDLAELVVLTHRVKERYIRDAVSVLKGMSTVREISNVIRAEGDF